MYFKIKTFISSHYKNCKCSIWNSYKIQNYKLKVVNIAIEKNNYEEINTF